MAKVSPVSIKYMIYASFCAQGPVEKPDVIGAIFGQTEGLLGSDLEMRELQKEGKIGRIEVDLSVVDGKSVGEIRVPSALDKSETTIIAATLETIDRIGPTEAKIEVSKIEDVRGSKRDYIVERARKLLEGLDSSDEDMAKSVREESRVARIGEYGDDKLPCGDLSGNEVVVVEGRADVVNLIKNRVFNVIGMSGAKLSKDIARLGEEKELTLFVDGDRGGNLIAKNVIANANIAYVAVAPDGKEVEELQGKEILISLRKRWPAQEFMRRLGRNGDGERAPAEGASIELSRDEVKKKVRALYAEIKDSKKAILTDSSFNIIQTVGATSALGSLMRSDTPVKAII
ncbi:MAG TPA: DNA primase DnaG, partial [Candidatus Nanoarchaeia archaeon]|nr:DNA primase DnaG [Candidatus Nanoarchaeia archaeon]